ncbi:MAG: hypothetical protein SGJ09_12950 [Phycisphaerae bacterium]|nr:hypothetical protein [Phycisphaerae bacterium]
MRAHWILNVAGAFFVACSPTTDPISANRQLGLGDEGAVRDFTPDENRAALAAMQSAVTGDVERPTPALDGVRWRDVPEAARIAADAIDLAIVTKKLEGDTWRFQLVSVRNEPGELVVKRRPPPEVVAATVRIGTYGQRDADAARYRDEFMRVLKLLGKKKAFE